MNPSRRPQPKMIHHRVGMEADLPSAAAATRGEYHNDDPARSVQVLLETPRGRTAAVSIPKHLLVVGSSDAYDSLLSHLLRAARGRDLDSCGDNSEKDVIVSPGTKRNRDDTKDPLALIRPTSRKTSRSSSSTTNIARTSPLPTGTHPTNVVIIHEGRVVDRDSYASSSLILPSSDNGNNSSFLSIALSCRGRGGMADRQNRAGSKFGGGGVSSAQQQERERKERLRQLALESIDLAKDPYLMRNHLGTYECKLCLTLHTNEANYLAHTQGKKHQQGLARRAHMEKLKQEKEQQSSSQLPYHQQQQQQAQPPTKKLRIGRPAYQVFKSRDPETSQRCLSFELQYPDIDADLQPRHRFMSAFEQKVEAPPDRRFQYLLFAAEPYETVAFKIPNEPIDKGEERFVTHWDADDKKFTLTLYFLEQQDEANKEGAE